MSLDFTAIDARRSAETAWRAQSVYLETVPVQKVVMSLASAFPLTGAIIIVSVFFGGVMKFSSIATIGTYLIEPTSCINIRFNEKLGVSLMPT